MENTNLYKNIAMGVFIIYVLVLGFLSLYWKIRDNKNKKLLKHEQERQHDLIRQINKKLRHDE